MKRIALLWAEASLGQYAIRPFPDLWRAVGENNGNLAFVHAIRSQIVGDVSVVPWSAPRDTLAAFDVLVVPCANQVGPHIELGSLAQHWREVGRPIVAIGLGAQANSFAEDVRVSEGTFDWLRVIDTQRTTAASNIWTRGPYSSAQLDRLGFPGAVTGNCPTHFINEAADLGQRVWRRWAATPAPRSIAVAAGYQHWERARMVEQQLVALMQDHLYPGVYIAQSAADMVRISLGGFDDIPPAEFEAIRAYVAPHLTPEEFTVWCRRYARSYYDIPAWMEVLSRHDLTIGPRYHGTALAIQSERMGVTVAIDSRTEEMCGQTGVPFLRVADLRDQPLTRSTLKAMIAFDPDAYDSQRAERAQAYLRFLEDNELQPADFLKRIAGSG